MSNFEPNRFDCVSEERRHELSLEEETYTHDVPELTEELFHAGLFRSKLSIFDCMTDTEVNELISKLEKDDVWRATSNGDWVADISKGTDAWKLIEENPDYKDFYALIDAVQHAGGCVPDGNRFFRYQNNRGCLQQGMSSGFHADKTWASLTRDLHSKGGVVEVRFRVPFTPAPLPIRVSNGHTYTHNAHTQTHTARLQRALQNQWWQTETTVVVHTRPRIACTNRSLRDGPQHQRVRSVLRQSPACLCRALPLWTSQRRPQLHYSPIVLDPPNFN
jgi:hypothetical protein